MYVSCLHCMDVCVCVFEMERAFLMHDIHVVHFRGIGQTSFDHVLEVKFAANVYVELINDDEIDSVHMCV